MAITCYKEYQKKERIRGLDKRCREQLADSLARIKTSIVDRISQTKVEDVKPIQPDLIIARLDQLENKIRYASYGYSGAFDIVKIDISTLDRLYEFDRSLSSRIEQIKQLVAKTDKLTNSELSAAFREISSAIKALDEHFDERRRLYER
ncbi:MAG: hypothetical protein RMM17_12855 [Acidobacteriota bacterium]|nr:hypothetical protein [Blastocatellia bacterium]MDW8413557.1 hypothetical protein [Acidobacteriota bacterium]